MEQGKPGYGPRRYNWVHNGGKESLLLPKSQHLGVVCSKGEVDYHFLDTGQSHMLCILLRGSVSGVIIEFINHTGTIFKRVKGNTFYN